MAQVLRNLLSNAIKFTPIEGEVTVTITAHDDHLEVSVRDSGVGISFEDQTRLFNEAVQFHTKAQQAGGGSGLGLWISKRIMDLHGGSIAVQSEGEGRGAIFSIALPMRRAEQAEAAVLVTDPRAASEISRGKVPQKDPEVGVIQSYSSKAASVRCLPIPPLRILVVDDSALNRKMLTRLFVNEGHSVVEADDGDTAIEVCSRDMSDGKPFNVITMDNVRWLIAADLLELLVL